METVLNWIWQGSVVALAAAGMLRLLEPARAHLRYRALWIALLAILVLPLAPFLWTAASVPSIHGAAGVQDPFISLPTAGWLSGALLLAAAMAWTVVSAARVVAAALALRRARRECRPVPADVEARLSHWSQVRTTGRQTRLVVSDAVRSAAVLAGRVPLIALAPSVLDQLRDDELDRVVVHEWAHVQRHDDVGHLLQLMVRLFAGWHPAVWWCDRRLHLEREVACDEMAVAVTGSTKAYAACLARLASLRPSLPLRRLQAVGVLSGSNLRHRVVRILSIDRAESNRGRVVTAVGAPIVLGGLALLVGGYPAIGAAPETAENVARALAFVATANVESVPSPVAPSISATAEANARPNGGRRIGRSSGQQATVPARPMAAETQPPAAEQFVAPLPSRPSVAAEAFDSFFDAVTADTVPAPAAETASSPPRPVSPWITAADAGVAVGGGAQDAALATAGFFNRLGRKIAVSF